jgi:hypothetical protein
VSNNENRQFYSMHVLLLYQTKIYDKESVESVTIISSDLIICNCEMQVSNYIQHCF